MDLKEFFRDLDDKPQERARLDYIYHLGWQRLNMFPKPTIAMVNGYCFGGAFTRLIMCDLAIAADEATFGLSEINWGIFPGGIVTKAVADTLHPRDALYYTLTGEAFDGKRAAEIKLVNYSVPLAQLREETIKLAEKLLSKNPAALRASKETYKFARTMSYQESQEYFTAKMIALQATDPEKGRAQGIKGFVEEKRYRPGLENYRDNQ
jgi:trans-feruloyl-CoA hydratase/vanillin synthase